MLICAIDIGTTNLKVGLYDETNHPVWLRSEATPRVSDRLGSVTNAIALTDLIERMIIGGWHASGRGRPIVALSTSGVGEDGVYVDADLQPLGPAIPWFDMRAQAEADELAQGASATPRAGIAVDPTRTAAKWLWGARNIPEMAEQAASWICLTDYPLVRWAGSSFMSNTLASRTGCYDPVVGEWIEPLLAACRAPHLPRVSAAGDVVGTLRSRTLLESGVADSNTLVVAGGHDHPAAAYAVHGLSHDARVDSMGTANVVYGDAPPFALDRFDPAIAFMASIEGPQKLACIGVFEFTATVNRFPGGIDAVRKAMALPRLPGSPATSLARPIASERQLLEWATLNARRMLERLGGYGVPEGPIYATGGWARSTALLELRASIFGAPIHVPEEKELSLLGAALLAAKACGGSTLFDTPITIVEPNRKWTAPYADLFAQFTEVTWSPAMADHS